MNFTFIYAYLIIDHINAIVVVNYLCFELAISSCMMILLCSIESMIRCVDLHCMRFYGFEILDMSGCVPVCMDNQISYVWLEMLLEGRPRQRRLRLRGAVAGERRKKRWIGHTLGSLYDVQVSHGTRLLGGHTWYFLVGP